MAIHLLNAGLQAFTPFVAAVAFLLQPLQAALQMDSTRAGYPIPSPMGVWSMGFASLLAVYFCTVWRTKRKSLFFFLSAGYLLSVLFFPSRSLLLVFPAIALVFIEMLVWLSGKIQALCGTSRRVRGWILSGILLALCFPNLLAIRVGQFRGRLANGFSFYSGLRAAQPDVFTSLFQQGISEMKKGREAEALLLLQRAARVRPFLFQHLLGPCRLSDLRWITGSSDLRGWVRQIGEQRVRADSVLTPQDRQTLQGIQQEISDYALCLFSIAHLERRAGRLEESRRWLSQIRTLERDPERLISWMGRLPPIPGDPMLEESVAQVGDPNYFRDPLPWRMDDYGFGRFLVRLWAGLDIRSTWDKQMGLTV